MNKPSSQSNQIIIIGGPTTSGKSNLAVILAQECDAVIINADAMQMYHEIPIITAQPTGPEQQGIPHELYGILSASENGSVFRWLDLVRPLIDKTLAQGKIPILVGGTGMYLKSLYHGISPIPATDLSIRDSIRNHFVSIGPEAFYKELEQKDPIMASRLKPRDSQRMQRAMEVLETTGISLTTFQDQAPAPFYPPEWFRLFFLELPRNLLYQRCNDRFKHMIELGIIEEIKALDALNLDPKLPAMRAHGVPEIRAFLQGTKSLAEAIEQAQTNTRHYVKRQFTWFRSQLPEASKIQGESPTHAAQEIAKQCLL